MADVCIKEKHHRHLSSANFIAIFPLIHLCQTKREGESGGKKKDDAGKEKKRKEKGILKTETLVRHID